MTVAEVTVPNSEIALLHISDLHFDIATGDAFDPNPVIGSENGNDSRTSVPALVRELSIPSTSR